MSLKLFNHLYKEDKNFKEYSKFFAIHLEGIDIKELLKIPEEGEYVSQIEILMDNIFENQGSKQSTELKDQICKLEEKLEKLNEKENPKPEDKDKKK